MLYKLVSFHWHKGKLERTERHFDSFDAAKYHLKEDNRQYHTAKILDMYDYVLHSESGDFYDSLYA